MPFFYILIYINLICKLNLLLKLRGYNMEEIILDIKIKFYSHFIDLEEISINLNSCSPYNILNLNLI